MTRIAVLRLRRYWWNIRKRREIFGRNMVYEYQQIRRYMRNAL